MKYTSRQHWFDEVDEKGDLVEIRFFQHYGMMDYWGWTIQFKHREEKGTIRFHNNRDPYIGDAEDLYNKYKNECSAPQQELFM